MRCCAAPAATSPTSRRRLRCTRWCCARRTRMRVSASPILDRGARDAGRAAGADRRRHRRLGPLPCPGRAAGREDRGAALSDPGARTWCAMSATRSPSWSPTRSTGRKDAAEAIAIAWEPLPHVIGADGRAGAGRAAGLADRPGNLAFETDARRCAGDRGGVRARPRKTVALTIVNQRLVTNYLDTRGVIAEYDAARIATR